MKWAAVLIVAAIATYFAYNFYEDRREIRRMLSDDPLVWEEDIKAFEQEDARKPPPANAILFVGSSSIRYWTDIHEVLAPLPVIHRGFGGCSLSDMVYYADRIIIKYKPAQIVMFAGTNDLIGQPNDKTPEQLFGSFSTLTDHIHKELPETKVYYLSITPSVKRWHKWPEASRTNALIKGYADKHPNTYFIDMTAKFLKDGKPNADLLRSDMVHLNKKGYAIWNDTIRSIFLKQTNPSIGTGL